MSSNRTQASGNTKPNQWYLAYGSNLSSDTFRGRRGIRPLAQANVVVPSLEITFDLPGIPYWEPCFANVRKVTVDANTAISQPVLMGVAYLVTPQDFARIIATEGGGLSYQEVVVECHCLPVSGEAPKKPAEDNAGLGTPVQPDRPDGEVILASTLLAPNGKRRSTPMQPSQRYVNILRAGARENNLPSLYIAYLDSIPYYHWASLRHRVGALLFLALWGPPMLFLLSLHRMLADPNTGHLPKWLGVLTVSVTSAMWRNYAGVWKPVFGSGEVTAERSTKDLEHGEKQATPEELASDVPFAHLDFHSL